MLAFRSFALVAATVSLSLLALTSAATPANAQVTTYNNRATFNSATSGLTTINFNNHLPARQNEFQYPGATFSQQGVTFTGNGNLYTDRRPGYNLEDGTALTFQQAPGAAQTLKAALLAGTTAFGLDFGDFSAQQFTFSLSTGDTFTFLGGSTAAGASAFASFTSTTAITSFTISNNAGPSQAAQIDRFSFQANAPAVVPEPSEWAVIGMTATTLGGLMVRARRRTESDKSVVAA